MRSGSTAILSPRLVDDLEGTFFVPDYQRGYRWGGDEVRALLQDIKDAGGRDYFLQPVVVKEIDENRWELVDGQQRLTTLYLLQRYIKRHIPYAETRYTLEYETRPDSAAYLDKLTILGAGVDGGDPALAEQAAGNIDFFHMHHALECIDEWFSEQKNPPLAAMKLYEALAETVFVIWYEVPQTEEFDSRQLFTRLNVGRIPLTDAELVKALLLSRIERPLEAAAQWDSIERDLHGPEVWAFATGTYDGEPTRISLLLDTLADRLAGPIEGRARPLFHTFETLRPRIEGGPADLWSQVVDLHSLILGWYDDRSLFHKIGHLIASGVVSFLDLVDLAGRSTKSGFESALDARIRDDLGLSATGLGSLTYKSRRTSRVLLLMNVETVRRAMHSSERYSFHTHALRQWSLEHIHAQHSEGLNTVEQWTAWLKEHRQALDALDRPGEKLHELRARVDAALPSITNESFQQLHDELTRVFSAADDITDSAGDATNEVDSIANLALLALKDNIVLGNAVFEVKRRQIIEMDRRGEYIPVCTRNVFLKYYTDAGAQQLHFWGPHDREGYLEAMREMLEPYLLEDRPENDDVDDLDETEGPQL